MFERTIRKVVENRQVNDEDTSADDRDANTRRDPVYTGITRPRIDERADDECHARDHGRIQACFCTSEGEVLSKRG